MGQYKVPQNVESEDKLIGPLSIKQFVYVMIALTWGALTWKLFWKIGIPIFFLTMIPVTGFFLILGLVNKEEQSFENYFIAFIRYLMMPRKRIWMKDDHQDVIIKDEAPKVVVEDVAVDPVELRGKLKQLAMIVDNRGYYKSEEVNSTDPSNIAQQNAKRVYVAPRQQEHMVK